MKSLRVRRLTFRETIEIYDTDDDQVLNNGSDEDGRGYMDMYNAALLAACRVVRGERAHEQSHGPWLIIGPGIARFPDAALGTRNGAARGSPRPPNPQPEPPGRLSIAQATGSFAVRKDQNLRRLPSLYCNVILRYRESTRDYKKTRRRG
jgi:hypothetical protein